MHPFRRSLISRAARTLAAVIVTSLSLTAPAGAQPAPRYNPNGWIRTDGWVFLYPFTNPYGCDGGGPTNMLRHWVAPHDPAREPAKDGTRWGDIDFGGEAVATGYGFADLWSAVEKGTDPVRWFTYADLLALPGVSRRTPPRDAGQGQQIG